MKCINNSLPLFAIYTKCHPKVSKYLIASYSTYNPISNYATEKEPIPGCPDIKTSSTKPAPIVNKFQLSLKQFIQLKSTQFYSAYCESGDRFNLQDYYDLIKKFYNWPEYLASYESLQSQKYLTQILYYLISHEFHTTSPVECGISLYDFYKADVSKSNDNAFPTLHELALFLTWTGNTERWIHNYDKLGIDNNKKHKDESTILNITSAFFDNLVYPYTAIKRSESEREPASLKISKVQVERLVRLKTQALRELMDRNLLPALQTLGPHYDTTICQRAIYALSRFSGTDKIKQCLQFVGAANISGQCTGADLGRIIGNAFKSSQPNEREFGWNLLRSSAVLSLQQEGTCDLLKWVEPDVLPRFQDKIQTFQALKEPLSIALLHEQIPQTDADRETRGLNLLKYMASDAFPTRSHNVYPSLHFSNLVKDYFENLKHAKWEGNFTKVTNNGRCQHCQTFLKPLVLSQEEFKDMKEAFLRDVIKGNDVYLKTTPKELDEYLQFLDSNKFDVVIDALNVCLGQAPTNFYRFKILANVIEYFTVHRKQRVAVFGRRHMLQWNKRQAEKIFESYPTFLLDNISKDDPFLIYAAMHAGLGTTILTKDMFRDHKYALGQYGAAFNIWRKMHQLYLLKVKLDGTVLMLPPLKHDIVVQGQDECKWHIPYESGVPLKVYENINTWLCLQKESKISIR